MLQHTLTLSITQIVPGQLSVSSTLVAWLYEFAWTLEHSVQHPNHSHFHMARADSQRRTIEEAHRFENFMGQSHILETVCEETSCCAKWMGWKISPTKDAQIDLHQNYQKISDQYSHILYFSISCKLTTHGESLRVCGVCVCVCVSNSVTKRHTVTRKPGPGTHGCPGQRRPDSMGRKRTG